MARLLREANVLRPRPTTMLNHEDCYQQPDVVKLAGRLAIMEASLRPPCRIGLIEDLPPAISTCSPDTGIAVATQRSWAPVPVPFPSPCTIASAGPMTTPKHEEILRGFRDMRLKTAELEVEYEERGRKRVIVTLADAVRKPTATKFRKVLKQAFKPDLVRLEYPQGDHPASVVATAAATQKHRERNPGLYVDFANIMAHYHAAETKRAAEREAVLRGFHEAENGRARHRQPSFEKYSSRHSRQTVRLEYPLGGPPASVVATAAATQKHRERNPGLYVDFANIMAHYHAAETKRAAEREAVLRGFHEAENGRARHRQPSFEKYSSRHSRQTVRLEYPLGGPPASVVATAAATQKHRERNPGLYVQYDNIMAQFHAAEAKREAMRASSSKAPPAPPSSPVILPAEHSREQSPSSLPAPAPVLVPAEPSAPVHLPAKPSAPVLPVKPSAPVHLTAKHSREQSPSSSRPLPSVHATETKRAETHHERVEVGPEQKQRVEIGAPCGKLWNCTEYTETP
ncbi:hypothetical protein HDU90_005158 [Geranomyces variabilis]|nr:hypothetical protein HDU90_005158 [Geranomyces variabilis]